MRKIVIVFMCMFMVTGSVLPINPNKVSAIEMPTEPEEEILENGNLDYPSTTDIDFDITSVDLEFEDISKRTYDNKTFRRLDGTYVLAMYDDLIHYEEDGELTQFHIQ